MSESKVSEPVKGKVAIIGSGLIGSSWAIVWARAGYSVCLFDTFKEALPKALEKIKEKLDTLSKNSLLKGNAPEDVLKRITTCESIEEATKNTILVQECIPEKIELKKQLFGQLDKLVSKDTILGSSTSGIPASQFTEELEGRSRCIVVHPVNPPEVIPLVELVPSPWTDPKVLEKSKALMEEIGQVPVILRKEVNGFVQPRLQYAIMAEIFRLIEDNVLSPEDIDKTVIYGLCQRWSFLGVVGTLDLNAPKGVTDYCDRYMGNMYRCVDEMDNSRKFDSTTYKKMDESMRKQWKVEDIPKMWEWRNKRLMAYARHLEEDRKIDEEYKKYFGEGKM